MNAKEFFIYLLIMAGSTYLIRVIPFVLIRHKIKNRFFNSFLYYVPYTVLTVMTLPTALFLTGHVYTALAGLVVSAILAFRGKSLTLVALAASLTTLIIECIIAFI